MKKALKYLSIVLFAILFHQLYWYFGQGGNLIVFVSNHTEESLVDISLYVDGEKKINDKLEKGYLTSLKVFPFKLYPGKHHMKIIAKNGLIEKEFTFYSWLVRRVVIEYIEDDKNPEKPTFHISSEYVYRNFVLE